MTIHNLAPAIFLESVALTVTRTAAPTIALGRAVPGTTSTLSIVASVQPLSSKELEIVPEGMRARGVRKVFTATKLQILPMPDVFSYKGDTWEITDERDWLDLGNYYRYLAVKKTFT